MTFRWALTYRGARGQWHLWAADDGEPLTYSFKPNAETFIRENDLNAVTILVGSDPFRRAYRVTYGKEWVAT